MEVGASSSELNASRSWPGGLPAPPASDQSQHGDTDQWNPLVRFDLDGSVDLLRHADVIIIFYLLII